MMDKPYFPDGQAQKGAEPEDRAAYQGENYPEYNGQVMSNRAGEDQTGEAGTGGKR